MDPTRHQRRPQEILRTFVALACAVMVLCGCAAYRKCGLEGCAGDAQITSAVQALLSQHADLGPPNLIRVQTIDGVVYLTGEVNTDLVRETAESVARQAQGAKRVVNSIAITYSGH